MRECDTTSRVEELAIEKTGKPFCYAPTEKIRIVEIPDFPSLGRLTALRFIEWLQRNPEGVISLPTGKTPEHFIKWTNHFLHNWVRGAVQATLGDWGIDTRRKPRMDSFRFVQIDEFYPMNPSQHNSFAYYINRFYFKEFGLDPSRAVLLDTWQVGAPAGRTLNWVFPDGRVDLSLRYRSPATEQEELQYGAITAADQLTMAYEDRIVDVGGIGFFLGGIGPDGHIGFNIRGSDHRSTTRLIPINYETAAAAATDLGGIEISRQKVVMTIGLRTITRNPTATAIVTAAGESKARVVRDAVEGEPSVLFPGTALHGLPGARFYVTRGAASLLVERRYHELKALPELPRTEVDRVLIDTAWRKRRQLVELKAADLREDRLGQLVVEAHPDVHALAESVTDKLKERITLGMEQVDNLTVLHTAPHHDDIMLGYFPYIIYTVRNPGNSHYFATLTSGFTSVTNAYTLSLLRTLMSSLRKGLLDDLLETGYFSPENLVGRTRDIYQYLDGVAANSEEMKQEAEARRMLRNITALTQQEDVDVLKKEIDILSHYLTSFYPGKKDPPDVQKLKGMIREWEEELLWGHLGLNCDHIFHLRLGFYTGDIFTPQPEWDRDVKPVLDLLEQLAPDVVTVALDPEGTGPDTHYKVLQTIAEALKAYLHAHPDRKVTVWGYRNVWYRFHPAEADIFVPVSMNSLAILKSAFHTCFGSQRAASFPSHEYDGPFCDLAQKIMVEQYSVIKNCVGRDFYYNNPMARLRASRGLNFLRIMSSDEFFAKANILKQLLESQAELGE